ncbi:hypothetical protein G6514_002029 [Epicoccum nigrum]|nr:hypothetical protein G6514_002029 [Epicoccum nigrum]
MSQHARQPTLLRMVMDPSAPTTPTKTSSSTPIPQGTDANRTELEPTPLLLALDMQAERKRLRSRKDSVFTGAVEGSERVEKVEGESAEEQEYEKVEMEMGDGKEVIIPVKEDLSYLALVGRGVGNAVWSGVEGVRKSVWGVVGWA